MIILASQSPTRQELFANCQIDCKVIPSHIDESTITGQTHADRCINLAVAKITAILSKINAEDIVVGGDTVIVHHNDVLEKPKFKMDAVTLLTRLSDSIHTVISGFAIYYAKTQEWKTGFSETRISFRNLTETEIINYCNGYPVTIWSGAYNSKNSRASSFVSKIDGSLTGLYGLPMEQIVPLIS